MPDEPTMAEIWDVLSFETRQRLAMGLDISLGELALTRISEVFSRSPFEISNCTINGGLTVTTGAVVTVRDSTFVITGEEAHVKYKP